MCVICILPCWLRGRAIVEFVVYFVRFDMLITCLLICFTFTPGRGSVKFFDMVT